MFLTMQIHSISKVLSFVLILIGGAIVYFGYSVHHQLSVYIFVPVVFLVVLYVFHGPLDHWFISKYPLKFDTRLREWLIKYFPPYQKMSPEERSLFEYRLTLYMDGRLFQSVGSEMKAVPEDIKCMVAAHGVWMGLGQKDYLLGEMDRIYLYKHPFPTPSFQFLHTVEVNTEDGVIILSLEQLTNAVLYPSDYYNIAYHAYAEAFMFTQKGIIYPDLDMTWAMIEQVSTWSKERFLEQTGMPELSTLPVHISLYFSMPESYQKHCPELWNHWERIFRMK